MEVPAQISHSFVWVPTLMILLQFVWTNFSSWFEPFERFNRDSNSFWNLVAIQVSALSHLISTKVDGSNSVRFNSHRLGVHAWRLPVICWRHCRRMRARKCCFVMKKWCWVRSRVQVHVFYFSHQLCLARVRRRSTNPLARAHPRCSTKVITHLL